MSRAQLFSHSQVSTDDAGIFVARSRNCMLISDDADPKVANDNVTTKEECRTRKSDGHASDETLCSNLEVSRDDNVWVD